MQEALTPLIFHRHTNPLRAVILDDQPWFVATDFGRLIGERRTERLCRRMDPDQLRTVRLRHTDDSEEDVLALSESGLYKTLFRFHHPEHRALRLWLNRDVIPLLRDHYRATGNQPRRLLMTWANTRVGVLDWQGEIWVPLNARPTFPACTDKPKRRWPRLLY